MPRLNPTEATLKALFARSGNQCAFPGCKAPLIDDKELFVGQVIHICAASQNGARYDTTQTDEDRRSFSNLMAICYPHHVRVDRLESDYPAPLLSEMKASHEGASRQEFIAPDSAVELLTRRLNAYWSRLAFISTRRNDRLEVSVDIDIDATPEGLCDDVLKMICDLRESVPSHLDRDVGDLAIYIHNRLQNTEIKFRQVELMLLHSLYSLSYEDDELESRITRREKALRRLIETEVIHD